MDFVTLEGSVAQEAPRAGLSLAAQALWWQAKGDWHRAHQCAQQGPEHRQGRAQESLRGVA
jgi:hypothetical protein